MRKYRGFNPMNKPENNPKENQQLKCWVRPNLTRIEIKKTFLTGSSTYETSMNKMM